MAAWTIPSKSYFELGAIRVAKRKKAFAATVRLRAKDPSEWTDADRKERLRFWPEAERKEYIRLMDRDPHELTTEEREFRASMRYYLNLPKDDDEIYQCKIKPRQTLIVPRDSRLLGSFKPAS